MRVAVVSAVYNEKQFVGRMIESVLSQSRLPDEVVLVDDGSTDATPSIVQSYAERFPIVRLIQNSNQGPAASRNVAWRAAKADVVIFTDGDCVPERDWIEKLVKRFGPPEVAAVAGTYRTLNTQNKLARFVGHEIAWRYRDVPAQVDAHGAYNLAIRKDVLEELGGFDESYKAPSGEDWDLTYRISRKYKILFAPDAIVAHAHPESFWPYMKNQVRRGFDRIKLYNDHPEKMKGDAYTGRLAKYQVLAAACFPLTLWMFFCKGWCFVPAALFLFLVGSGWSVFRFIYQRDPSAARYGVGVQFARNFAWALGAVKGLLRFGIRRLW